MAVNLYTTCSVLTVGCPVYTDSGRTTPAGNGQYYDGTTCWTISGGIITGTGTCAPYSCGGGTVTGTYSGSNYHLYVDRTISTTSNPISIISWDAISRPNRFSVYDNNGLITSSGWVGTANYAGPWGASLSTPSTGNIYFTFATTNGRYVRVEAGPADPGNPTSDSYSWNLSCVTTTTTTSTTTTTTTPPPTTTTSTTTTTTTSGGGTFDLNWSHYKGYSTGTSILNIYVNTNLIVQSDKTDNGSIVGLTSSDVITYSLTGTSVNFNNSAITVSDAGGTLDSLSNCGFGSSTVANTTGINLTQASDLNAASDDYVGACP